MKNNFYSVWDKVICSQKIAASHTYFSQQDWLCKALLPPFCFTEHMISIRQ